MSRRSRLALLLFAALACTGGPARADGVVADLSSHLIAITTGFTGASVVLFGATEGRGDIITVVRGPEREMTVWRKGKVAGIWVNAEAVVFGNVPSFMPSRQVGRSTRSSRRDRRHYTGSALAI